MSTATSTITASVVPQRRRLLLNTQQGIGQNDLQHLQSFIRTLLDPNRKNPNNIALLYLKKKRITYTKRDAINDILLSYAPRYGNVYSPNMKGTIRELNAAFKVKLYFEAIFNIPEGQWDINNNIWVDHYHINQLVSKITHQCYIEALKVIHNKISQYKYAPTIQLLNTYVVC